MSVKISSASQSIVNWDKVEAKLSSMRYAREGAVLSERDAATWSFSLSLLGTLVCDLTLCASSNVAVVLQWIYSLARADVFDVLTVFKAVDRCLVSFMANKINICNFDTFKGCINCRSTLTAGVVLAPFRRSIIEMLSTRDVTLFSQLHQVFTFISKVSLLDIAEDSAPQSFRERNDGLKPVPLFVQSLNKIVREWFTGFSVFRLPAHSSGSTADAGRSIKEKVKCVGSDALLRYVLQKNTYPTWVLERDPGVARVSRMVLVPKNGLTRRIICCEPATLQFWQHAVQRSLYDWFAWHPAMHIPIYNQNVNRQIAARGAINGAYATIDMSSASDYVSWDLVKNLFKGTAVLEWLFAVRSRSVILPDGTQLQLKMHAPMGSAVCFPVMCVVFAAICEWVVRAKGYTRHKFPYSVYGDDIACRCDIVEGVMSALEACGFVLNVDKSFVDVGRETYRESCGGEYWGEREVTPLRLSTRFAAFDAQEIPPQLVPTYVELCNALYNKGYLATRKRILKRLMLLPSYLRPPFGDCPGRIHTFSEANWPNEHRLNKRLQRLEVRCGTLQSVTTPIPELPEFENGRLKFSEPSHLNPEQLQAEEIRYLLYWLQTATQSLETRVTLGSTGDLRWSAKWLSALGYDIPRKG